MLISEALKPKVEAIISQASAQLAAVLGKPVELEIKKPLPWFEHPRRGAVAEALLRVLVCETFGINWEMLTGPSRLRCIAEARQLYCYMSREMFRYKTLKHLACELNKMDHTVIIYSCKVIKELIETEDPKIYPKYKFIKEALTQQP